MTDQFKDQVLREIRSNGIKHTLEEIFEVVSKEVELVQGAVISNEWQLIRNMLEATINGPCDRLQYPQRYGNPSPHIEGERWCLACKALNSQNADKVGAAFKPNKCRHLSRGERATEVRRDDVHIIEEGKCTTCQDAAKVEVCKCPDHLMGHPL